MPVHRQLTDSCCPLLFRAFTAQFTSHKRLKGSVWDFLSWWIILQDVRSHVDMNIFSESQVREIRFKSPIYWCTCNIFSSFFESWTTRRLELRTFLHFKYKRQRKRWVDNSWSSENTSCWLFEWQYWSFKIPKVCSVFLLSQHWPDKAGLSKAGKWITVYWRVIQKQQNITLLK